VAAPNTQSTTQIRYSWNEGKTWTKLKVSNDPIFIDNIIIEPKSTSQQFIIYGSYDNSTDVKSLLPGRAFRSEHAQLRPEPHSIASHGPDPMATTWLHPHASMVSRLVPANLHGKRQMQWRTHSHHHQSCLISMQ
jgi:hypothetical protein